MDKQSQYDQASKYLEGGKIDEALKIAIELEDQAFKEQEPNISYTKLKAKCYQAKANFIDMLNCWTNFITKCKEFNFCDDHIDVIHANIKLAKCYGLIKEYDNVISICLAYDPILQSRVFEGSPWCEKALQFKLLLAKAYVDKLQLECAQNELEKGYNLCQHYLHPITHPLTVQYEFTLATVYDLIGQNVDAYRMLTRYANHTHDNLGDNYQYQDLHASIAVHNDSLLEEKLDYYNERHDSLLEKELDYNINRYDTYKKIFGEDNSQTTFYLNKIAQLKIKLGRFDYYFVTIQMRKYNIHLLDGIDLNTLCETKQLLIQQYCQFVAYFNTIDSTIIQSLQLNNEFTEEFNEFKQQYENYIPIFFQVQDFLKRDYSILFKCRSLVYDLERHYKYLQHMPEIKTLNIQLNDITCQLETTNDEQQQITLQENKNKIIQNIQHIIKNTPYQQSVQLLDLDNIKRILNSKVAIVDVYSNVIDSTNYHLVISKDNEPREYTDLDELKNGIKQYKKIYYCTNTESTEITNQFSVPYVYITSLRSLIDIEQYVAFTNIDYTKIFPDESHLPGLTLDAIIFKDFFPTSNIYQKKEVTKSQITQVKHPKILHICTHGFKDEYKLMLSLSSDFPDDDNYYLTPDDVKKMDLNGTELVFLNVCYSGKGSYIIGKGIDGFREAFGLAGAKYIICSLTETNDFYSIFYTKKFYEFYKKGMNIENAFKRTIHYFRWKYIWKDHESLYNEFLSLHLHQFPSIDRNIKDFKGKILPDDIWNHFILHKS